MRKSSGIAKGDVFSRLCLTCLKVEVEKEYRFDRTRRWRFDYAIPEHRVAIEVEGAAFKRTTFKDKKTGQEVTVQGGRHNIGKGYIKDMEKYNTATVSGWKVLRVTPSALLTSGTIEMIKKAIECE